MKKVSGKRKSDETNIDLTPMLDVVFILLIFFVVTATFLSETAIQAASSESNDNPPPPQDEENQNILFEIGPNNEIILNKQPRPIIPTQIRSNIDQLKAENPAASVIIQPNNQSSVATLVLIMDAARQAGMASISIVEPPARSR
jgi:biopolymer transport protein ExbD